MHLDKQAYIWGNIFRNEIKPVLTQENGFIDEYVKSGFLKTYKRSPLMMQNSVFLLNKAGDIIITCKKGVANLTKGVNFTSDGIGFISLFEDSRHNLWTGKTKGGIYLFPKGDLNAKEFCNYLNGETVSSITEDREGGMWFTTLESGVFYMASQDLLYYDKSNGFSEDKVLTLIEQPEKSILAGLTNGDIISITKNKIVRLKAGNKTHVANPVYRFYQQKKGAPYITGAYKSFSFEPGEQYHANYLLNGQDSTALKCFTSDQEGNLWAGNYMHLLKIDPRTKKVTNQYLAKSRILSLYTDKQDTIW